MKKPERDKVCIAAALVQHSDEGVSKTIFDGPCIAVSAFYSDQLVPIVEGRAEFCQALSVTQLFERAGGEVLSEDLEHAFDDALNKEDLLSEDNAMDPDSRKLMEETIAEAEQAVERYRQATGRKFPPVYRMKLRVELEEASPEDAEKFWLGRVRTP